MEDARNDATLVSNELADLSLFFERMNDSVEFKNGDGDGNGNGNGNGNGDGDGSGDSDGQMVMVPEIVMGRW